MAYNKSEPVIMNLWQKMSFLCGKERDDGSMCMNPMSEAMHGNVPVLECKNCSNSISFYDVEKFASFISKTSVAASKDGEDINFTNCKHIIMNRYTKERVLFHVLEDKKGKFRVAISKEQPQR